MTNTQGNAIDVQDLAMSSQSWKRIRDWLSHIKHRDLAGVMVLDGQEYLVTQIKRKAHKRRQ